MLTALYMHGAPWLNMALAPFGLTLWGMFDFPTDEEGMPCGSPRVVGLKIGRRIRLDRS
jgi:hypothetical protein